MKKIIETSNYDKFELHEFNRSIHSIKRLQESMNIHGWIDAYPMHVVVNGSGKLKIKSGHHRFEAARSLRIAIKYVVCDDDSTIHELERSTSNWSMRDYLESYSRIGNQHYLKLNEYHRRYGIPLNVAIPLIQKDGKWSNYCEAFKNGDFKTGNTTHAERVGGMVLYCDQLGIDFSRNSRFVWALSKVMHVDGLEIEELKKKIKSHLYIMAKQADIAGYVSMLEKVYNRQRGRKLAIAINALS